MLASASPRRARLLRELVPDFTVDPAEVDEDALTTDDPATTAQRLAREKALAVSARHPESLVIAGDTVVAFEEDGAWTQLAKPADSADAFRMLSLLAGRDHLVITGVCLRWPAGLSSFTERSTVTFRSLTDDEIMAYVATGEPLDKAGAYGLQDSTHDFIARVEGSVTNVIGLPMERLKEALSGLSKR